MADVVLLPKTGAFIIINTSSHKYLVPVTYETEHAANVPARFHAISSGTPGQLYLVWTSQFVKAPNSWVNNLWLDNILQGRTVCIARQKWNNMCHLADKFVDPDIIFETCCAP